MKIIKFLVLGLLVVGHLSCSKDDDNNNSADIVGTWMLTDGAVESTSIVLDIGGMPVSVEVSGSFIGIDDENRIHINEDKTFTSVTGNLVIELEMVVMGIPQTERVEASDLLGSGTWNRSGNELHLSNDNGTTILYHIDNINETHLELSSNISDLMLDGGSNPMLEDMDINVTMKLQRI